MHGNTRTTTPPAPPLKTRHFSDIISEITSCLRIHAEHGSRLGGVSLEFTGEVDEDGFSVTECLGGSMELSEEQLGLRYQVCKLMVFLTLPLIKLIWLSDCSRSAILVLISSRVLVCHCLSS